MSETMNLIKSEKFSKIEIEKLVKVLKEKMDKNEQVHDALRDIKDNKITQLVKQ
jgi:hypothetical protein